MVDSILWEVCVKGVKFGGSFSLFWVIGDDVKL